MRLNPSVFDNGTIDERKAELAKLKDPDCALKLLRPHLWGDRVYLVTGDILLKMGTQTVEVIDMTEMTIGGNGHGVMPLAMGQNYHRQPHGHTPSIHCTYIITWHYEYGQPQILLENGDMWPVFFADLAINVSPPSVQQARTVYRNLLEAQGEMMVESPDWLTTASAAALLDDLQMDPIPASTLTNACRAGHIVGAVKHGRDWMFRRQDFMFWLANRPKPGPRPR